MPSFLRVWVYAIRRYCNHSCLLVGWFVCSFMVLAMIFPKTKTPVLWNLAQMLTEMGYLVLVLVLKYIFYVLVLVLVLGT